MKSAAGGTVVPGATLTGRDCGSNGSLLSSWICELFNAFVAKLILPE
jgi:hypothetical protein